MHPTPLHETDLYVLFQDGDKIFLFDKDANADLWSVTISGGATCGIIALSNEWVLIGGRTLTLWKNDGFEKIDDPTLRQIRHLKQVSECEVEVLVELENGKMSGWLFDILDGKKTMISDPLS